MKTEVERRSVTGMTGKRLFSVPCLSSFIDIHIFAEEEMEVIFEGRNLLQQTIYHWKGNVSKSPIHFRDRQNILISRLYERFSLNDFAMAPEKISNF